MLTEVAITGTVSTHPDVPLPEGTHVSFELNTALTQAGSIVAVQQPLTVELDPGGTIPAGTVLYATDDPLAQPDGAAYVMIVRGAGIKTAVFYFNLSHLVATFDISNAVPGTPPPSTVAYATQAYVDSRAGVSGVTLGTTVGATSLPGGEPVVTFTTPWGINSLGVPYFDANGAAAGEEAVVRIGDDGQLVITQVDADVLLTEETSVAVASVPVFGVYESATTVMLRSRVLGDRQDRFQLFAGGNEAWFGDGQNPLHRLWHVEPHVGGHPEQMSGVTCFGLDSGLTAALYRGVYYGKSAGSNVVGGQSVTLVGDAAGQFTQSNETAAFGVNTLANIITGNFCTGLGGHVFEALISGHRGVGSGDEAASYLVDGSDVDAYGFYALSTYGELMHGDIGKSPQHSQRACVFSNYGGSCNTSDVHDPSDICVFGYNARVLGDFSGAFGSGTRAYGTGSWAFGTAADGTPAIVNGDNKILWGTPQHTVYMPGSVEMTLAGKGIVMQSPNGTRYEVKVANDGTLSSVAA